MTLVGQMQDVPLTLGAILDHAARHHPGRRILSVDHGDRLSETNYAELREQAVRAASALRRFGLGLGDRVGVMAWNNQRHLALWYGVPGAGGVLHTLNPRLFPEQLVYIINHAEDRIVMLDADLVGVLEPIAERLPTVEAFVVLTDGNDMPETTLPNAVAYDDWIAGEPADAGWAPVDERAACGLCYTSGTTGDPKGVVYSHRSNTLHAMAMLQPDVMGISSRDVVLPVVPMFHANGWSVSCAAPMAGAGLVMPGRDLSPATLYSRLEQGVTLTLAVPTVWLGLLPYLRETGQRLSTLERVVIGGSACPQSVLEAFERDYGVRVVHAWGMTETSSLGTISTLTPEAAAGTPDAQMAAKLKVGRAFFGIDLMVADAEGGELPRDGEASGHLLCRGFAVVERYLKAEAPAVDASGWFDTGDVGRMDAMGYVDITDRSKDVIKSGGEWISSIQLENIAVGCPGVIEAAAVGRPDEKWGERPVLAVVAAPGATVSESEVLAWFDGKVARWQKPDKVVFLDEIPHTATGKISKLELRRRLSEAAWEGRG